MTLDFNKRPTGKRYAKKLVKDKLKKSIGERNEFQASAESDIREAKIMAGLSAEITPKEYGSHGLSGHTPAEKLIHPFSIKTAEEKEKRGDKRIAAGRLRRMRDLTELYAPEELAISNINILGKTDYGTKFQKDLMTDSNIIYRQKTIVKTIAPPTDLDKMLREKFEKDIKTYGDVDKARVRFTKYLRERSIDPKLYFKSDGSIIFEQPMKKVEEPVKTEVTKVEITDVISTREPIKKPLVIKSNVEQVREFIKEKKEEETKILTKEKLDTDDILKQRIEKLPAIPLSDIDDSIKIPMKKLKELGVQTLQSCSGLDSEHEWKEYDGEPMEGGGYVSFYDDKSLIYDYLKKKLSGTPWRVEKHGKDDEYWKGVTSLYIPIGQLTDEQKKAAWDLLIDGFEHITKEHPKIIAELPVKPAFVPQARTDAPAAREHKLKSVTPEEIVTLEKWISKEKSKEPIKVEVTKVEMMEVKPIEKIEIKQTRVPIRPPGSFRYTRKVPIIQPIKISVEPFKDYIEKLGDIDTAFIEMRKDLEDSGMSFKEALEKAGEERKKYVSTILPSVIAPLITSTIVPIKTATKTKRFDINTKLTAAQLLHRLVRVDIDNAISLDQAAEIGRGNSVLIRTADTFKVTKRRGKKAERVYSIKEIESSYRGRFPRGGWFLDLERREGYVSMRILGPDYKFVHGKESARLEAVKILNLMGLMIPPKGSVRFTAEPIIKNGIFAIDLEIDAISAKTKITRREWKK